MTSVKRATVQLNAITPSDTIEEILPNTSRCPPMNAVDSEEEDGYRANDRECGQATLSTHIDDGSSCEDDSNTESTTVERSQDQLQELDDTWGQGASEERTGGSHTAAKYISRTEEGAFQEQDGTCGQDISSKGAIDASTGDSNTQVKYNSRREEEDAIQEQDGACGKAITSTVASDECYNDSHTQMKTIYRRESTIHGDDGACGQDENNLTTNDNEDEELKGQLHNEENADRAIEVREIGTHSECERSRSKMESLFSQRFFDLEEEFPNVIQTCRQQSRLEMEQYITCIRTGWLVDCKVHAFGAIYKAMPDARRRFTVQLVQKYAWLKEEMTESVARNVAQTCLSARHLEYLQLKCNTRLQYVGHFLKMVLRCGKQQIEHAFLNALQTEGREGIRLANEVEKSLVTSEKMKAFEDLQRERTQYHISEERLPIVCFHQFEVDLLNDHLFSRLLFSYKEHSDIEESNGKGSLFFDTFRKCQENVFDEFKTICNANDIFIDGNSRQDESTITDVIIDEPSTPPSLQSIGIETIHTNEGSLVMILKLKEEHSFTNLKDKCEDGSIGDVLIDLCKRKDVRDRLSPGTYKFKMTLHATKEDAHFVKMKIEGTIFDQKEQMCLHRTGEDSTAISSTDVNPLQEHPRYICEELEISDQLLDILQNRYLVPCDIAHILRVKVNRRDKIHELLRHYHIRSDEGFSALSDYINTVRELRGKKAYPLKLFEGKFVSKYDGSCFSIVHTLLIVTWTSSSVAGKPEDTRVGSLDSDQSHSETKPVCRSNEARFDEIIPEAATAYSHAITPSGAIEKIFPNTSRCPQLNVVDCEEEYEYRANDKECDQASLSTKISDGSSSDDYRNTQSTTFDRSEDQRREPDDTSGQGVRYTSNSDDDNKTETNDEVAVITKKEQFRESSYLNKQGANEEKTGDSHTTAKYISRTEEDAFLEQDGACGQDISSNRAIDASTGDSNTQVKYISRREEEDAIQEQDGACGQGASSEGSNDSHTQMKHIYSREGTIQDEVGACGQEPIKLIGAEATEFAVELLEDFTKECTEISKQQLDIFRQQTISEHSRGIFQQKTGAGRDFSSIFNAMSECRQCFTVQLVRNYCLMKEEMTEAVARRIATACLAPAYVEELDYIKERKVYVGSLLKLVLRSGTEQIERRFVSTLQHEEKNMADSLENTSVSKDDMAEFAKLQIERHDYNIQNEDLPRMFIGKIEVEILNDNLFSSVYFSYSEHTHIENNIGKSVDLFLDTIRKSKVSVLSELELICKNKGIMCVSETLPSAFLQDRPYIETLENIGIETIDMDVGSIVLTLQLKDENAFADLKEKCLTGSLGDVLCDLSKGEQFTQLLKCHSQWDSTNKMHKFKMTLHAIEEEVHFVKMRIEGDLFKDSFCNVKTCGTEHPAYICEELEITDDLLATLKDEKLVPRDIEDRLRMLTTRRGKIHELLSNYNTRKEIRFQTLATNIKLLRESRSKEAYPVKIFDGKFVYTICDGKFTRINHMRGAWLFQQEISACRTVDHILYDTCDSKYAFEVCETLAESGRRYATSDIKSLPFDLVDKHNDCVVLIASTGVSPLKNSSLHHDFRRMILDTEHMLNVLVIHENNLGDKRVDLWMNEHIPMPFEVRHVGSNDKLCLEELFGSIHKRRFPHDQHLDINILPTGDTFAHANTVYRELTKEGVGCTLMHVDSRRSLAKINGGKVLNVSITGKDAERDLFKLIQRIIEFGWFGRRNRLMIKPIDIDLCNDQWLPALKLELKGDFSYDVEISIDCADRFDSRNLLLQYRLLASSGLRCILVLENDWNDLPTRKVIHSKATLQIKYNTGLLCLRNQFDVTRDDQMWPFKVKAMIKKNESPKRNEERTRTIIIRHLEGRFEYENKIYTEVVNLGLGCRIVSEFSDEDFVYPDTVPCVLIHKGVDLNNESLFGHTEKVWQVLILDMDDNSAENVHTLMKGLRYRIHGIDLENVRWPQELLKRLTGIQKTVDGTAYQVCISFDNCNAKHAEIVYKGLENIGHRCLYRSTAAHEKGFRHDDCLWLQKVPSEYIDVDSVYDVPNQQLKVLVNDKTSKGVIEPLEANTISISLEDTEWPEKVKAKLKAFQSIDKPKYHESALTEKLALSRSGKRSKIDERKSSSAAFQSIKKPKYHESALTEKLALSRSGYRSMIDETKSSSADVAD